MYAKCPSCKTRMPLRCTNCGSTKFRLFLDDSGYPRCSVCDYFVTFKGCSCGITISSKFFHRDFWSFKAKR